MKELTISEIVKHPAKLRDAIEQGEVRITWKEPKPNGKITLSVIAKKEDITKC